MRTAASYPGHTCTPSRIVTRTHTYTRTCEDTYIPITIYTHINTTHAHTRRPHSTVTALALQHHCIGSVNRSGIHPVDGSLHAQIDFEPLLGPELGLCKPDTKGGNQGDGAGAGPSVGRGVRFAHD